MRIDVFFTPAELETSDVAGCTAVVIDVVRATTSIVTALANGAAAVYPSASTEEAVQLATSLGREDTLLCGERKGIKIEGYDFGNSPSEFSQERVKGLGLVMNTTNGTRAFLAAESAGSARAVACAPVNLGAVADRVRGLDHVAVGCAGRDGGFALEDALVAGMLLERIGVGDADRNEPARASMALADSFALDAPFLATTEAGRITEAAGLLADLEDCAALDRYTVVPELSDRVIRAR